MCGECANCELDIRTVTKGNNRLFELGKHLYKIRSKHETNCGEDMNRCDCDRGRSLRGGKRNRCPFPVSVDFAPASTQGMPFVCKKSRSPEKGIAYVMSSAVGSQGHSLLREKNRLGSGRDFRRGIARTQPAPGKGSARGRGELHPGPQGGDGGAVHRYCFNEG